MASIGSFSYKRKFTFADKIASDLTNFPVCIIINSTTWSSATERGHFFVAGNTSGKRVQFYASDQTTNLAYEVEKYDSANESAIYWVCVPTLSGSAVTDIYVGYGNDPNGSAQDNMAGVWDANFLGVWHLGDNSWGSSPEGKDSSASARHFTDYSTSDQTGKAGQGRGAGGNYNTVLRASPSGGPTGSSGVTVSGWVKHASVTGNWFFGYGPMGSYNSVIALGLTSSGGSSKLRMSDWGSEFTTGAGFTDGTWGFFGYRKCTSGNNCRSRINLSETEANLTLNNLAVGSYLTVGELYHYNDCNTVHIDELRFSNIDRGDDWLVAEYWSLHTATSWPGDGWLTIGAETAAATQSIVPHLMAQRRIIS